MDKFKKIKIASILGMIGNLFLLVVKIIVALVFQSGSMLADAFNSAGDIFSSTMTFIGNKISSKPIDEDHDLGHGKAEYVFSLIISVIMILSGMVLIKNSITKLLEKETLIFSWWLIIVCIVTIVIKFSLYLYTNFLSKKFNLCKPRIIRSLILILTLFRPYCLFSSSHTIFSSLFRYILSKSDPPL